MQTDGQNCTKTNLDWKYLLSHLTISQSEGDANASSVLAKVNDIFVINAFSNGLNNLEIITTYTHETIREAKDEEKAFQKISQVYQLVSNFKIIIKAGCTFSKRISAHFVSCSI